MSIETIRMSSKGQVVIPQDIRESMKAKEGTLFAVVADDDTVILKKISTPSKEELIKSLGSIAKQAKTKLKKRGIIEADLRKR
ncbi:AbrB/MazE/SpoVT family DNA-binding domain-containing protein [Thermoproteota archaeon]